jgi:hypothetical protein
VEAAEAEDAARAAEVEVETLRGSLSGSIAGDTTADGDLEGLARERARQRTARWAAAHPHGGGPEAGAPGGGPGGRAPGGGGVASGGGAPGWGARGGAPGYHGLQAVVRDVGPGGGWPTLTKTNYVEWAAVMEVKLQVRHMWEAVRYGDVDYDADRRALDALITAAPPEMQFTLSKK